ncbi:hypothetical protein ACQKWADRAFT_327462 [Trichoderma austrokoningii]
MLSASSKCVWESETAGNGSLGNQAEVFDGKAKGLLEGIRAGIWTARKTGTNKVVAFLDNQAVIHAERKGRSGSSYAELEKIWDLKLHSGVRIGVRWVQGHAGIPGNEKADQEAGEGTTKENAVTLPTAAYMRRVNRRARKKLFEDYWQERKPEGYKDLELDTSGVPEELKLPRPTLHRLLAERTRHGDYGKYHERFHHNKEPKCACGKVRETRHILRCERIWGNPEISSHAEWMERVALLGNKNGGRNFEAFLKKHNPYEV